MAEQTTLDCLEPITVADLVFNEPANEYWQLLRLWIGMAYLYKQAKAFDNDVVSRLPPNTGRIQFGGRTPPMLENAFDWYAVSATRFVRLVGEIGRRQDAS